MMRIQIDKIEFQHTSHSFLISTMMQTTLSWNSVYTDMDDLIDICTTYLRKELQYLNMQCKAHALTTTSAHSSMTTRPPGLDVSVNSVNGNCVTEKWYSLAVREETMLVDVRASAFTGTIRVPKRLFQSYLTPDVSESHLDRKSLEPSQDDSMILVGIDEPTFAGTICISKALVESYLPKCIRT